MPDTLYIYIPGYTTAFRCATGVHVVAFFVGIDKETIFPREEFLAALSYYTSDPIYVQPFSHVLVLSVCTYNKCTPFSGKQANCLLPSNRTQFVSPDPPPAFADLDAGGGDGDGLGRPVARRKGRHTACHRLLTWPYRTTTYCT